MSLSPREMERLASGLKTIVGADFRVNEEGTEIAFPKTTQDQYMVLTSFCGRPDGTNLVALAEVGGAFKFKAADQTQDALHEIEFQAERTMQRIANLQAAAPNLKELTGLDFTYDANNRMLTTSVGMAAITPEPILALHGQGALDYTLALNPGDSLLCIKDVNPDVLRNVVETRAKFSANRTGGQGKV